MIKTFKDKQLEKCWKLGDCKKVKQNLLRRILMKLDSMDAVTCIEDLQNPPSNNLHKLQGKYKGFWAVSINGQWRLVFKTCDNDIYDVMLLQYH